MQDFKFGLGDKVKDKVTSFEGIIVGMHTWLNNCNTYSVQPQTLKDGVPQDRHSFDEPQLMLMQEDALKEKATPATRKTGGPERKVSMPNRI